MPICHTCRIDLTEDTWLPSSVRLQHNTCKFCVRKRDAKRNSSLKRRYTDLKDAARKSGGTNITREQHAALLAQSCHYCTFPLNPTSSGLDQKIPGGGYSLDNVVPCCLMCNKIKNNHLSYEEMLLFGPLVRQVKQARLENVPA